MTGPGSHSCLGLASIHSLTYQKFTEQLAALSSVVGIENIVRNERGNVPALMELIFIEGEGSQ